MKVTFVTKVMIGAFVFLPVSLAAIFAQSNPAAIQMQEPQLRLPLMGKAPVIDGVIHPEEWDGASQMQGFTRFYEEGGLIKGGGLTPQKGEFWLGADEQNLYVAVRTETPPGGKLLARANPVDGGASINAVFADDAIEVRVIPDTDAPATERRLYLALFNARGTVADSVTTLRGGVKWHGNWKVKNSIKDEYWHSEIALPWADIGVDSPLGKTMGVRIGRDWRQAVGADQTEWGLGKTAFDDASSMPRVIWDAGAPVVQTVQLQDAPNQPVKIKVRISNPGSAALKTDLHVFADPVGSPAQNYRKQVEVEPGQHQELTFPIDASLDEDIQTRIHASSPDGKRTYYLRDFIWQRNRPKVLWNLNPEAAKLAEIKFAYFPSYNAMHVEANLANMPNRQDVKGIELSIRRKGVARAIVKTTMPPVKNNVSEIQRWNIPSLPQGQYELVAQLQGVNARPVVQNFVRHRLEWEGNRLGKSDIVVPPFTPIKVNGDEVGVVLRRHRTNGLGLWNQVTAAGKPLLKAPMRLEATFGGKVSSAQGQKGPGQSKVLVQKPTEVVTEAKWQAGALKGSTRNEWDYDGVVKTTFTLAPPTAKVDRLTLVIPLDNAETPLMHAVTFGGDYNYSGEIKAGNGVVWKSADAPGNAFIGTYVPYLWVGGAERGFAVFGENDAGWITDDKTSCQEIVRKADGTLELHLKLVQQPTQWKQPRKITIGFQATPVKPLPKNWRTWTVHAGKDASSRVKVPGLLQQFFLGTTRYWGSVAGPGAIYPADGDMSLWHEYTRLRKTGKPDPGYLKKWSDKAYAKLSPELRKAHEDTMTELLKYMAMQPQNVLIYTDASGMRPDTPAGQTFINEWNIQPFPQREWEYASTIDYAVEAVPSYRDSRAWYYQKSLATFNDGIYWDVSYFKPNYNPITTNAYVRPDGRVQPSTGIWNVRALLKRGAVLAQEMGKTNRNMVHMSGANIVPINGFAATQADWELQYGAGDFQDKYPRDYILAQSTGRQAGLVPIVLLGPEFVVGNAEEAAWQYRTAAGVMLTHEIKHWWMRDTWGSPDAFWANYDKLLQFGYGQPNVKVFNYWDRHYPAKISGQTSSLIVSKPKSATLVICDYEKGGDITVKLDTKALGLTGPLKATNTENGQAVTIDGETIRINLKKHDFAVIRIDGK